MVVPPHASPSAVERFVGTHRRWIDERVADLSMIGNVITDMRPGTVSLAALDRTYAVEYHSSDSGNVRVLPSPGNVLVLR